MYCQLFNVKFVLLVSAQDVDGADFLGFTEDLLLKNFPKILYKQRNALMKIVKSLGCELSTNAESVSYMFILLVEIFCVICCSF